MSLFYYGWYWHIWHHSTLFLGYLWLHWICDGVISYLLSFYCFSFVSLSLTIVLLSKFRGLRMILKDELSRVEDKWSCGVDRFSNWSVLSWFVLGGLLKYINSPLFALDLVLSTGKLDGFMYSPIELLDDDWSRLFLFSGVVENWFFSAVLAFLGNAILSIFSEMLLNSTVGGGLKSRANRYVNIWGLLFPFVAVFATWFRFVLLGSTLSYLIFFNTIFTEFGRLVTNLCSLGCRIIKSVWGYFRTNDTLFIPFDL